MSQLPIQPLHVASIGEFLETSGLEFMFGKGFVLGTSPGAASQLMYTGTVRSPFNPSRSRTTQQPILPLRYFTGDVKLIAPADPILIFLRVGDFEGWIVPGETLDTEECQP